MATLLNTSHPPEKVILTAVVTARAASPQNSVKTLVDSQAEYKIKS